MTHAEPELRGTPVELKPGMVSANTRNGQTGTADRLPMIYRDGAMDAQKLPSRIGDRLHYPDGRVELMTAPTDALADGYGGAA